jgi:[ribosomal protein S5]-alanine N-acetyltransferase
MDYRAPRSIQTVRLLLRAPDPGLAQAVAEYFARNRGHFSPWDPPLAAGHGQPAFHAASLAEQGSLFDAGTGWVWWLSPRDAPEMVIGSVNLSNIVRGSFHSCNLGYGIDALHQGSGLMTEALAAAIDAAFSPDANLHRIQAAVRPENARSIAVVQRLGFRDEGLARDYLFNGGQWRDHRIFARINPSFVLPPDW